MTMPTRWPAANVKSSGSIGQVNLVELPIVTGSATRRELRFEESIMPLVTRHWVTVVWGLIVSLKHAESSGTDSPQHVRVAGLGVETPSPERVVCVLGP